MKTKHGYLTHEEKSSVQAAWEMLAKKLSECKGLQAIVDDYRCEHFTAKEWALGCVGALVFTLITSIL